jgi:hypothetical protein
MVMSQNFAQFFDGIVAGGPVYDLQAISLSEIWGGPANLPAVAGALCASRCTASGSGGTDHLQ